MNHPRNSLFRNARQISPERIAHMGDFELGDLMRDLLRAQAHRCGSLLSEVRVNTEDKAKDGGCDGWTGKPEVADEWLGDADTCWQFKAGKAGTPARLKGEVLKSIPNSTLEAGGRFVVVVSGSTNGKKGEEDRLKTLRSEAEAEGIPTDKITVIGSEGLTEWCNQNPAIAARWAGRPEGLWTLADWSRAEPHRVPWQASDSVTTEIAKQRAALDFEGDSILHLHIQGPPGVGKTRFALELCRDAPWSAFVIYFPQANDARLLELIDSAAADPGVRLMVVADEVQPEQLLPLRDVVGRGDGRIRLITIGHCKSPEPARIPALPIHPLDSKMTHEVVKGWYPAMPLEHVDFIAHFADGYMRLARLAADAVAKNTSIDVRGLLGRDEIRGFLDGMLGAGDRRALHVVAVLASVGWSDDKDVEGKAVAKHLDLNWNDVRAKVEDYHRRLGIAPRGGRYRYISPTPLGIHLAVEAWETFPDLLRSLPDVLPTEGARDAYYERLRSMASNPQAREYARGELTFFFRLNDFINAQAVQRWSALSSADPELAACNISRALTGTSIEERLRIEDRARREIIWTLVRLAWRSGAFADATRALALLAEAENESWSNNASGEFVDRFQIFLGGTAVPYLDRLPVLDELALEGRATLTGLVIKALARVGDSHASRSGMELPSDELPEEEWFPSTGRERLACARAAMERLTTLAGQSDPDLREDFVSAARDMSTMLLATPVRPLVARLFDAIREAYPEAREPLRRIIADIVHHERKYGKELPEADLAELETLHARFEDDSLHARLRQQVGPFHWGKDEQPDLQPLARDLLDSPDTLAEEWSWLTSGDAGDGWRLGIALAEEETEPELTSLIRAFENAGNDFRILCGYVNTWRQRLGDAWYDEWFASQLKHRPYPSKLLFEAIWRCGVTPAVARHIVNILCAEPVEAWIVGHLGFGGWGNELDPRILEDVFRAMIDTGHSATALAVLEHRIKARPDEIEEWRDLALALVTTPELIRSEQMTGYYWQEIALRLVNDHPTEIAAAIIREQGDRSEDAWFVEHSIAANEVLQACAERDPAVVWDAIRQRLSSKHDAYLFGIGFPKDILERIPAEPVLAWIDGQPEERASIILRLASKDLSNDETLAARVLGAYGDRDDVGSAFFSEYVSGGWWCPASAHWDELAASTEAVAKRTKLPKLRRWATDAARSLREMEKRDRQREEEEGLRGY